MVSAWQEYDMVSLHDGREFKIIEVKHVPLMATWPMNKISVRKYVGWAHIDGEPQYDFSGDPAIDEFSGFDIAWRA